MKPRKRKKTAAAAKLAFNTKLYREFNNKMNLELAKLKKKLK
jgi:hypothetical protein